MLAKIKSKAKPAYAHSFIRFGTCGMINNNAPTTLKTTKAFPKYSGYPCFNAPDKYVDALIEAGFDMMLTANNHTLDRRDRAFRTG